MKHSLFAVILAAVLLLAGCASSSNAGIPSVLPTYSEGAGNLYTPRYSMADISWKTSPIMPVEYDVDMYADAPADVKAQLAEIDDLIRQEKYLSAWRTGCSGEYGLAKKVEIAHKYFAFSMMHQMFAFKDLEPGETLSEVRRSNSGDFAMTMWDPVSVINDYIAENGESAILHMALAYYYCDTRMAYEDQWIMTREELAQAAIDEYQKAVDMGLKLDAYQTSLWGECYMELRDTAHAIPLLEKSLAIEDSVDVHYNMALCYWNDENWKEYLDKAIAEAVYSVQMYDYIPYRMDAIDMLIDMCFEADELELGDAAADVGLVQGYEDVDNLFQVLNWYLYRENAEAAIEAASCVLAMYPDVVDVLDDVATSFGQAGMFEQYNRFLEVNIARFPDNYMALGNLHFYYGVYWVNMDDHDAAVTEVKIARDYFKKAGVYEGEMKQSLESFINGK